MEKLFRAHIQVLLQHEFLNTIQLSQGSPSHPANPFSSSEIATHHNTSTATPTSISPSSTPTSNGRPPRLRPSPPGDISGIPTTPSIVSPDSKTTTGPSTATASTGSVSAESANLQQSPPQTPGPGKVGRHHPQAYCPATLEIISTLGNQSADIINVKKKS